MPRSITSKPAPSIIMPTRFLPISWISPLTVPMTILPTGLAPVSARIGLRRAMPAFIALADISTSGTNRIPSRKSTPTIVMPATSASSSTRAASQPRSRRICVPSAISSARPSYRSSCICSTSSSSGSSDRMMSSSWSYWSFMGARASRFACCLPARHHRPLPGRMSSGARRIGKRSRIRRSAALPIYSG